MGLSSEDRARMVENNTKIAELLAENEDILREAGYAPPKENYVLEDRERIRFPSGYIRTVEGFTNSYHLRVLCPKPETQKNIAYALESTDLFNYIICRFNIWGPVRLWTLKIEIVNLVSVMEALVLEATNNICSNASSCGKTKNCPYHFSGTERNNARKAIEKLTLMGILSFDEAELSRVLEIIDLRNRVHIRLSPGNEMKMDAFTIELYNEVIGFLHRIDEDLYKNAVTLYSSC